MGSSKGLDALFSDWRPFGYDLQHAMENLKDHYTFPIEEAVIVENMDNCIEEPDYKEIQFNIAGEILEIKMIGFGMDYETFTEKLPKLMSTTKVSRRGLGHYGWGMKVGMFVSKYMEIETKYKDFHGVQQWKFDENGQPSYKLIPSKHKPSKEDMTIVRHYLTDEYAKKITPDGIKKTLQKFYPTVIDGAPVLGRKLSVLVNGEKVDPPQSPDIRYKENVTVKIKGEKITGKFFFTRDPLPEEERGIAIIVYGRLICREYFGMISDKITGYLHADILEKAVAGDKTSIRRTSPEWRELTQKISKKLAEFMRKVGVLKEEPEIKEDLKIVNTQLAKILKDFPELNPMKFEIVENVLIERSEGGILAKLEKGSQTVKGTQGKEGEGHGVEVKPGKDRKKALSKDMGDLSAIEKKRKIKSGPQVRFVTKPDIRKEAWFSEGEGIVYINRAAPSYKKADKLGTRVRQCHEIRCAIDALLEWAVRAERINQNEYFDVRTELFFKWGEV